FFFLSALLRYDMRQEAFDWIRMAWGGMLERGATTWWEEWGDRSSLCHGWGSYPAYFSQTEILGVKLDELGSGRVVVAPDLLDLSWARGTVALDESGDKRIEVDLRKNDNVVDVHINAPESIQVVFDASKLGSDCKAELCSFGPATYHRP
ncbi:MAG: hypothetical protein PHT33_02595, partial [bacterium]|nr:hypothetical protein [bacterium]